MQTLKPAVGNPQPGHGNRIRTMVRFKVNYSAHISRNLLYLDYDKLKTILHENDGEEHALLSSTTHDSPGQSLFYATFVQEITKVEGCYTDHMIELEYALVDAQRLAKECIEDHDKAKKKAREAALKRSTTVLYHKLVKLDTYCLLNRTAAIKILKKHDKLAKDTGSEPCLESYMAIVDKTSFGNGGKLEAMKAQVETMYADVFCGGVHEEALGKLRLAKTQIDPRILLGVMFKVGIVAMLLIWLLNKLVVAPRLSLLYLTTSDPSVYVYAAVGALVTYRWFWGFSVYMWDSADIDYILILDLDANKHMPSSAQIFSDAANWSILYLTNVLIFHSLRYNFGHDDDQPPTRDTAAGIIAYFSARAYVMPALLVLGTLGRMLVAIFQPASYGVFSFKIFKKLVMSPFTAVHLRHTYAADILCSFVKVFSAMLFGACYFTSGSYLYASDPASAVGAERFLTCEGSSMHLAKLLIYVFPYYIRLMQCLRQRRDYFIRLRQQKAVHAGAGGPQQDEKSTASDSHNTAVQDSNSGRQDAASSGVTLGRAVNVRSRKLSAGSGPPRTGDSNADKSDKQEAFHTTDVLPFSDLLDPLDEMELARLNAHDECVFSPSRHSGGSYGDRDSPVLDATPTDKPVCPRQSPDSHAPLSRSESFDLPVPSVLRMLCGGSAHIVPPIVVHILKIIWVWPYSFNALRYFLNICVIVFGAYPPQDPASSAYMWWYIPLYVISTLYSCYWDVANDFQLLQFHSSRPLLRDKILYEDAQYFYYVVLVVNPILRFMWTLSFTPYGGHPFLVVFEIMRRSLWACIRMELGYIQELARRK